MELIVDFDLFHNSKLYSVLIYRITGYFRSRNFRRTLNKLNFEGFIFESAAELKIF